MKKLLLILPLVFLFCFTFGYQEQAEEGITNEQVNALIDEHLKIWNERNIALVDKCFSQDCVFENSVSHGPRVGSEAFKNQLSYEFKALSDINLKLKDVFIKDDKIAMILTWTATHSGPLVLPTGTIPATGKIIKSSSVNIARVANGKFVEYRFYFNPLDIILPLGFSLTPPQSPLVLGNFASADIYIKEVVQTNTYVDGKLISSKQTAVNELWIGDKKITYITPPRILIVDLEEKQISIVNRGARTYVEAALPLDISKLLSEQVKLRFKMHKTTGTVKETGDIKKIMNKNCNGYEVNFQEMYGDTVRGKIKFKVWATTDVSFDWGIYDIMLQNMRIIFNRDEQYRDELRKIKGIQMRLEMTTEQDGTTVNNVEEIVEISEKQPPAGIYSAPSGFTRKDKLTSQDF